MTSNNFCTPFNENKQAWSIDHLDLDKYIEKRKAQAQAQTCDIDHDANTTAALASDWERGPYKTIKPRGVPSIKTVVRRPEDSERRASIYKCWKRHVIAVADLKELFERMRQD